MVDVSSISDSMEHLPELLYWGGLGMGSIIAALGFAKSERASKKAEELGREARTHTVASVATAELSLHRQLTSIIEEKNRELAQLHTELSDCRNKFDREITDLREKYDVLKDEAHEEAKRCEARLASLEVLLARHGINSVTGHRQSS